MAVVYRKVTLNTTLSKGAGVSLGSISQGFTLCVKPNDGKTQDFYLGLTVEDVRMIKEMCDSALREYA